MGARVNRYREVLEEVQPHYISAAIAIAAAVASAAATSAQQTKAKHKQQAAAGAASVGGGGMGGGLTPTATQFGQGQGSSETGDRLSDWLKNAGEGGKATEPQQGLGLGLKSLDQPTGIPGINATPGGEFSMGSNLSSGAMANTSAMPIQKIEEPPVTESGSTSGSTANSISGYGQLAAQLYNIYKSSQAGPPQAKPLSNVQMDIPPTANRFGLPIR
jgi:hypothetical protein